MKAKALWHTSPETSAIIEQILPGKASNHLLIESLYSLVSLGTEKLVATGLIPREIWEYMKVPYMEGSFLLPCKYGYSLCARVLKGPPEYAGKLVHLMHPHQDRAWVEAANVFIIPDGIPAHRAALASHLETAVNAVWDSGISLGDTVLVAGYGLVGALIALLASDVPGVKVTILEKNEFRCQLAAEMGFSIVDKTCSNDEIFDLAFHTSGDEKALQFCIDHIGFESQVTEVSFYGKKALTLVLGETFHTGRKKIIASQVSHVPVNKLHRWDLQRRKQLVFSLLQDDRLDRFVTNRVHFENAPVVFNQIRYGLINEISVVLQYK